MKKLNEYMETPVNEKYNPAYEIAFLVDGKTVKATVVLDDVKDADLMDRWCSEQVDNTIRFANFGPHDIEVPEL